MFRLSLSQCAEALDAQLKGVDTDLKNVSIDTRTMQHGDVYVAIRGDQFDGHRFIDDAIAKGASAIVADASYGVSAEGVTTKSGATSVLQVADTKLALGGIASLWAEGHQVPTIAVTGSNGKTSVKEMLASILNRVGPTLATKGNLNNDIGVPLTLLSLREKHRYAVIEMGANHAGEIGTLSKMTQPDVAVVTNIGTAHIEGFGSIDEIAQAKSEIFSGVSLGGSGVVNIDDHYASQLIDAADGLSIRTFGFSEDADVQGIESTDEPAKGFGRSSFQLQTLDQIWSTPFSLLGRHNVMNALAATAAVQCLDIQREAIVAGLKRMVAVNGRLQKVVGIESSTLINDTYNANPASTRAAIDVLASFSGEQHLVLGNMAELGEQASQLHAEIGLYAKECGIDQVWTTGELAKNAANAFGGGRHFFSQAELLLAIESELTADSTVLVKGSRSSKMELIVRALTAQDAWDTSSVMIDLVEDTPS